MNALTFAWRELTKWHRPGLDTLIHYVTSACPAACEHCFFLDRLNQKGDLTPEETFNLIGSVGPLNALLIGGGEPFACRHLAAILSAYVVQSGIRFAQIPTLGWHTDRIVACVETVLGKHPDLNLTINLSIDGFEAFHDANRKLKGAYAAAFITLARLKELQATYPSLRVGIVTVLMPSNIGEVLKFGEEVWKSAVFRPDIHILEVMRSKEFPYDRQQIETIRHGWKILIRGYYALPANGSTNLYRDWWLRPLAKRFALKNFDIAVDNFLDGTRWPAPCVAGKKIAVVYPEGDLAVCELRPRADSLRRHGMNLQAAMAAPLFQAETARVPGDHCDCTHGCFIPPSVRHSPRALLGLLQ